MFNQALQLLNRFCGPVDRAFWLNVSNSISAIVSRSISSLCCVFSLFCVLPDPLRGTAKQNLVQSLSFGYCLSQTAFLSS